MWRCSVTHLMPGCKLICLVGCLCRSFKCSPLLSSTQLVFGVVLESCKSSTSRSHLTSQRSFIRMHVWRVKWRLLTLSTQDGKEEEEEEEGEVSVTLSTLSSSRHCILDDVMWNYGAFLQPNSFFFFLAELSLGYASFTGRCRRIIWVENKELKKKKKWGTLPYSGKRLISSTMFTEAEESVPESQSACSRTYAHTQIFGKEY